MIVDEDGFTLVIGRRAFKKNRYHGQSVVAIEKKMLNFDQRVEAIIRERKRLKSYFDRISQQIIDYYLNHCEMICYGVGSFNAKISQTQMALALLLEEKLQFKNVFIFDPAMDKIDHKICAHFKFTLVQKNERGRRKISSETLFYMPHCPLTLYDNILLTNYTPESLSQIVIIGNDFQSYSLRLMDTDFLKKAPHVHAMLEYTKIRPLPKEDSLLCEFGALSIHSWSLSSMPASTDSSFWTVSNTSANHVDAELI